MEEVIFDRDVVYTCICTPTAGIQFSVEGVMREEVRIRSPSSIP